VNHSGAPRRRTPVSLRNRFAHICESRSSKTSREGQITHAWPEVIEYLGHRRGRSESKGLRRDEHAQGKRRRPAFTVIWVSSKLVIHGASCGPRLRHRAMRAVGVLRRLD
jgi:hypothetical protein